MRRVWLVGHGFLGSFLTQLARARGLDVCTIDCAPDAGADIVGDAAEPTFWQGLLRQQASPDVLILCQATRGGDAAAYERSYVGVLHVIREAWGARVPQLIFCSSSSACGGRLGERVDERASLPPLTPRARILREAEQLVLEQGGLVLRLGALYGGDRLALFHRYRAGVMPVAGGSDRWLNYSLREQVAAWILSLMEARASGLYHLVTDQFTKGEALALMQELTGLPIPQEDASPSRRGGSDQRVSSIHPCYAPQGYERMRAWVAEYLAREEEG